MRPQDLLEWVKAEPFRPFRIVLNSGRSFEVRHPEMLRIGRSTVHVYTFHGDSTDVHETMDMISLLLIERWEPLQPAASTDV